MVGMMQQQQQQQQRQLQKSATLSATVELCAAELAQLQTSVTSDMRARATGEAEGDLFERTLAGNAQLAADAAAGMVTGGELGAVLASLRSEPTDDEECSAKFKIFEGYSKIVEDLRKETFGFWAERKSFCNRCHILGGIGYCVYIAPARQAR